MPRILWRIEDETITLTDRARLGVTLQVPERAPLAIPPLTLGAWPFSIGDRQLELRSVRNLDRLRYQLWCQGHLLPRGDLDRRRALNENCAKHPADRAICLCSRCRRPWCKVCSPNGIHCAPCLDALADEDRVAAVRSRRLGLGLSVAIGLSLAVAGKLTGRQPLIECGVGVLFLVVYLYARGLWLESKERRQGRPSAIDRR